MNKRLFCKVSLRLGVGLALRLGRAICPFPSNYEAARLTIFIILSPIKKNPRRCRAGWGFYIFRLF